MKKLFAYLLAFALLCAALPAFAACLHNWTQTDVGLHPTCTKGSWYEKTCTICGRVERVYTSEPLGHNWGRWNTTQAPSCTEKGKKTRSCKRCGKTASKSIEATGHSFSEVTTIVEPTCLTEGEQESYCVRCKQTITETLPKADHTFGEWVILNEAVMGGEGTRERTCSLCDYTESETYLQEGTVQKGDRKTLDVYVVQQLLKEFGYLDGAVDGIFGNGTRKAVLTYQEDTLIPKTGAVYPEMMESLLHTLLAQTASYMEGGILKMWDNGLLASTEMEFRYTSNGDGTHTYIEEAHFVRFEKGEDTAVYPFKEPFASENTGVEECFSLDGDTCSSCGAKMGRFEILKQYGTIVYGDLSAVAEIKGVLNAGDEVRVAQEKEYDGATYWYIETDAVEGWIKAQ